ncbi:hypothetical protein [Ferruginibacter sp.]
MRKPLFAFILALIIFNTAAVAQDSTAKKGWMPKDRTDFINDCIKTAKPNLGEDTARNYCYCMQSKIEKKYPSPDELEQVTAETLQTPEWKKEINDCLSSTSNWTNKDRSDFYNDCVKTAQDNLGADKAKSYCSCMLVKIEKKYPDAADLSKITEETLKTPDFKKMIRECLDNY